MKKRNDNRVEDDCFASVIVLVIHYISYMYVLFKRFVVLLHFYICLFIGNRSK